jgi:hypothetical protein
MSRAQVGPAFGGPALLCSLSFLASFSYSFIAVVKQPLGLQPLLLMREWTIAEV